MNLPPKNDILEHTSISMIRYRVTAFMTAIERAKRYINKKNFYVDLEEDKLYKESDKDDPCDF